MAVARVSSLSMGPRAEGFTHRESSMTLKIYSVVLACLETAEALGWVQPLPPELGALFHRVIGTLVRLVEPRR